jgi:hypothetical protein
MKLIKELSEAAKHASNAEMTRGRVRAKLQQLLDKEFSGNDALSSDLLNGMMDFYDSHLHLHVKDEAALAQTQADEDTLWHMLPRNAKVSSNGDILTVSLGTMLDASVIHNGKQWDVIVSGYKSDITLGAYDSLEDVAEVLTDIYRKGKKWYEENDPDGEKW